MFFNNRSFPFDNVAMTPLQRELAKTLYLSRKHGITTLELGEEHHVAPLRMLAALIEKGFTFTQLKVTVSDKRNIIRRRISLIIMTGWPTA